MSDTGERVDDAGEDAEEIAIERTESDVRQEQEHEEHQREEEQKREKDRVEQRKAQEHEAFLQSLRDKEEKIDIEDAPTHTDHKEQVEVQKVPALPDLTSISNVEMVYQQDHNIGDINISVTGNVQKGSTFSSYTAYLISGEDAKGKFELARRYSEFDALRTLIKERWPGCFIPTLPEKNLIKNSPETIAERERLLDDFLKKVASNKNIYYGDEFQIFLRSGEMDISSNFEKQPKSSNQEIVNKYQSVFDSLAGKQVNSGATIKISAFKTSLKRIQQQLPQMLESIVHLAEAKDNLNIKLPGITQVMQSYERNTMVEFLEGNTQRLVYANVDNIEIQSQEQILRKVSKSNPFWYLSDLIKIEIKDCASFIQTIQMIDKNNDIRLSCENSIRSLQKQIQQLALGNSTISSMTTRKSKQQVKKGLEQKNKKLIEQRHSLIQLGDMISALIAYSEIDNYKNLKKRYYSTVLKKLSGYEAFGVIHLQHVWNEVFEAVDNIKLQES